MKPLKNISIIVLLGIACILVIDMFSDQNLYSDYEANLQKQEIIEQTEAVEPELMFGIPVDSFQIYNNKIKKNQFLSTLLAHFGVPYTIIEEIRTCKTDIFDLRKIRAGNSYWLFLEKDTTQAVWFVYQQNKIDHVVIHVKDSVTIQPYTKKIEIVQRSASATIETSLWNALANNNLNIELSNELSDIYAWTIDFFGLQKGDYFKIIYEEKQVEGETVGIEKTIASLFHHEERDFYAYHFIQDSTPGYYDENSNSLKKAFLKAPLKFSRISSGFTYSRYHPILKIRRPHTGVDYAAPSGTPVYALGSGKVIKVGWSGGGGRTVKIKHNSVYTTSYMHLSRYAKGLKVGDYVQQGQLIGNVGSTGLSTGPHLDFRCWKNGKPIDPTKIEAPPVEPVKDSLKEDYKNHYNQLKQGLDSVAAPDTIKLSRLPKRPFPSLSV